MMNRLLVMMLLGVGLLATPVLAQSISHVGQADPTTEGWTLINGGYLIVGAGNDGLDHWLINATVSSYTGYRVDNTATLNAILDNAAGWQMTATVSVPTPGPSRGPNEPFFGVRDPNNWWQVSLIDTGVQATTGAYMSGSAGDVLIAAVDISAYHTYSMIYDPTADSIAVSVDSGTATTFARSAMKAVSGFRQINFGDYDSATGGSVSHWANVEFAAVPEPATMVLLAMGGLLGLRRRR